jgi:mRNA interferase MazF
MRFSQWTVWLANLDPIVGSEQGKTRPVLIISKSSLNGILPVVNVIPIT